MMSRMLSDQIVDESPAQLMALPPSVDSRLPMALGAWHWRQPARASPPVPAQQTTTLPRGWVEV
jgi:hypothetical protein